MPRLAGSGKDAPEIGDFTQKSPGNEAAEWLRRHMPAALERAQEKLREHNLCECTRLASQTASTDSKYRDLARTAFREALPAIELFRCYASSLECASDSVAAVDLAKNAKLPLMAGVALADKLQTTARKLRLQPQPVKGIPVLDAFSGFTVSSLGFEGLIHTVVVDKGPRLWLSRVFQSKRPGPSGIQPLNLKPLNWVMRKPYCVVLFCSVFTKNISCSCATQRTTSATKAGKSLRFKPIVYRFLALHCPPSPHLHWLRHHEP